MPQLNLEDNELSYLIHVLQTKCLLGEALGIYLKISQQAAMQHTRGNGVEIRPSPNDERSVATG